MHPATRVLIQNQLLSSGGISSLAPVALRALVGTADQVQINS